MSEIVIIAAVARNRVIGKDNRLLWNFPRRRLTAEQLRDAMLTVCGRLNEKFGGESIMPPPTRPIASRTTMTAVHFPRRWIRFMFG